MRMNQVGDEFALSENEHEGHLPPLPEGLNWAGPIARRAGLDVYTVVKRSSVWRHDVDPTHTKEGWYRLPRYHEGKLIGHKLCPPGDKDYQPPVDIVTKHENGPLNSADLPLNRINVLTTDKNARKNTPIFSGVLRYFPKAMAAVAALSQIGNEQHNPGTPLHWDRSKSGDEWDALTRHLLEVGAYDTDGVRHSAKVAWRALAGLQKELEDSERTDTRSGNTTADAGRGSSCDEGELGPGC